MGTGMGTSEVGDFNDGNAGQLFESRMGYDLG